MALFGIFGRKKKEMKLKEELKKFAFAPVPNAARSEGGAVFGDMSGNAMVDCIFVFVDSGSPSFQSNSTRVIEIAESQGVDVVANLAGLVQLRIGTLPPTRQVVAIRLAFVQRLQSEFGSNVRIAHGCVKSRWGTVGTETRRNWGCFPVNMHTILRSLIDTPPGAVIDISERQMS